MLPLRKLVRKLCDVPVVWHNEAHLQLVMNDKAHPQGLAGCYMYWCNCSNCFLAQGHRVSSQATPLCRCIQKLNWKLRCILKGGSHLYVQCRSGSKLIRNWIKQSKPFLRANQGIKTTLELWKPKDQECVAQIDLWPIKIRSFRRDYQAIKHTFCRSKILIRVAITSTGKCTGD